LNELFKDGIINNKMELIKKKINIKKLAELKSIPSWVIDAFNG